METRLTLRPGMAGTKKLLARYGERLVCVRYLYDEARGRRLKTVELVVEETAWRGRARRPRRNGHDLVAVRIGWNETDLRAAVKKTGAIWRPGRSSGKCRGTPCAFSASSIGSFQARLWSAIYGGIWSYLFVYRCICLYRV